MSRINKVLMMVIAMVFIMISAVFIDRGLDRYEAKQWEKERVARYQSAYDKAADMQLMIKELSSDETAVRAFVEENAPYFDTEEWEEATVSDNIISAEGVSGNDLNEGTVSGGDISGNDLNEGTVSGGNISGNDMGEGTVSGGDISGNDMGEGTVSGNNSTDSSVSGNDMPEYSLEESLYPGVSLTLLQRRKISASYQTTLSIDSMDTKIIADSSVDFSDMNIACLGDSITEASNLDNREDYRQYSYPARLKEILGAKRVDNLGIGGSSIGRYWDQAFVERYSKIPNDTNLIIVMGGTNDGYCVTQEELGTLEERKPRTFAGDLDELMRGLKKDYPDSEIVFATPLPNILHDVLRKERENLLSQTALVKIIKQLAAEYEIPVIDLYNSNLLDTHDAAIIYNYMPDGVHGNEMGYELLARHFAAQLIQMYEDGRLGKEAD